MSATNANHEGLPGYRKLLVAALVPALLLAGLGAAVGFAAGRAGTAPVGFGPVSPPTACSCQTS